MLEDIFKRFKDFFKSARGRISKWWLGEIMNFRRKTNGLDGRILAWLRSKIPSLIALVVFVLIVVVGVNRVKAAQQNAIKYSDDYEAPEATANLKADGVYKSIAKNDKLELLFCEEKGAIQIVDLESGHLWKSLADEDVYPSKGVNSLWKEYMNSAINISYNDLKKRDSGVKKVSASKDCGYLDIAYIENGVSVTYGFLKPGIYVTVEYTLEDDCLKVRIPWDKVREEWKYAVTTVEVLPYLGACKNDVDGYIFYPDGCGAITCFDRTTERTANPKTAYYYAYSHKSVSIDNLYPSVANRYAASLPVYGIKEGNDALFAYVTEGEGMTGVSVYTSGVTQNLYLNHVGFEVYLRNVFDVNMYNMSGQDGVAQTGKNVQRVDKNLTQEDKVIRYTFLSGDKANYSGMAEVYRDYLLDNGLLEKKHNEKSEYSLALQLLMGTKKAGIIGDEFVKMTDFDDVTKILGVLKENGVKNTEVVLYGWTKNWTDYWSPYFRLGGKTGMKNLGKYVTDNGGADIFLESYFSVCFADTKGIDLDKDVAYDGLNIEISNVEMGQYARYLVNPYAMRTRNKDYIKKLSDYDGINIAYYYLGRFAYADYNEERPYSKNEMIDEVRNLLADTKNSGKKVAINGANGYTYEYADFMYGLREESYGLSVTDYSVPFVEMVLSGYIPYATEGAGNLSYDLDYQKLKWIEFGSMPYFYLTYEDALNLRDTNDDDVFSSTWSDWKDTVAEVYNEFNSNLGCVYGKTITEHKILGDDLRRLTYENGVKVYVNYSEKDMQADGITIPAKNYVVTGGER